MMLPPNSWPLPLTCDHHLMFGFFQYATFFTATNCQTSKSKQEEREGERREERREREGERREERREREGERREERRERERVTNIGGQLMFEGIVRARCLSSSSFFRGEKNCAYFKF